MYHFLLVFCSTNVSVAILHYFQDITTFSDIDKSFSFDITVEIKSYVRFPIHV